MAKFISDEWTAWALKQIDEAVRTASPGQVWARDEILALMAKAYDLGDLRGFIGGIERAQFSLAKLRQNVEELAQAPHAPSEMPDDKKRPHED